jgi:copper(I)-binding protein
MGIFKFGGYKNKRRLRKIKKFGTKIGFALIFLAASYLLSYFSFFLYIKLTEILLPVNNIFFRLAAIGLAAGTLTVITSLIDKRFMLTVIISFLIDCIVDSVFQFSEIGVEVTQCLPGLITGMALILAPWYILDKKLRLSEKKILALKSTSKEDHSEKYVLARKLIEDPKKIGMETLKELCKILHGINPKIDKVLDEVDNFSRAFTGDFLGFIVAHIKTEKEKDKEKKEKVLFFIDLVNDIREEIDKSLVRVKSIKISKPSLKEATSNMAAPAGITPQLVSIGMAIAVASTVPIANAAGVTPGIPVLSERAVQTPTTQEFQEKINTTEVIEPTTSPVITNLPSPTPKPVLTFSNAEKIIFVSAVEEGTTYIASSTGTYRFTITGGAYYNGNPNGGWEAKVMIYKNRPVDWSGPNSTNTNWDYLVGFPGDRNPDEKLTREQAEPLGIGQHIDITLNKDQYLILMVFDSKGSFGDNQGGMNVQVQKGVLTYPTEQAVSAITLDNGWGHFGRVFNGPPGSNMGSYIDQSTIAIYATIHNTQVVSDRLIGGVSEICQKMYLQDMTIYGSDSTISSITIPANSKVVLDFGGQRLVCEGAKIGLKQGDNIPVGFIFEKSGQIPVMVQIRATPE